jgi:hypothetical protein
MPKLTAVMIRNLRHDPAKGAKPIRLGDGAGRTLLRIDAAPRKPAVPRLPAETLARLREYRAPKLFAY